MIVIFICRHFVQNSGSYAGMIEEVSKFMNTQGVDVKILCCRVNNLPKKEKLSYATVIRFPLWKYNFPSIGMNNHYLALSHHVKKYLQENYTKDTMIIANGRASLGALDYPYILRFGQPAKIFLKNMEIAKEHVSLKTRLARYIHFTIQHHLEKRCVGNAQAFIISSKKSLGHIFDCYDTQKRPYFMPHSGVNADNFSSGHDLGFPGKNILFISQGTEKIRKGIIYLEKALPSLFEKNEYLSLIHVGKKFHWDIPPKYKKRIRSVGKVPWDKMANYYASCDMTVLCSLNEFIPNVVFESMVAGCPVVSSDMDGIHEVISHDKTGLVYPRGDVKELQRSIQYYFDHPSKAREHATKAQENMAHMDYTRYAQKLFTFLQEVMEKKEVTSVSCLP